MMHGLNRSMQMGGPNDPANSGGSNTAQAMFHEEDEKPGQMKTIQKAGVEEEEVQMKESSADSAQSAASGSSTQSSLPRDVNARMEASFNTNFSNVNIHTNDSKAAQMKALAFTQGNNVHFAPGQYNPHTSKGQELIGHEYTHVVQQGSGNVAPTRQAKGMSINDNPALEHEADVMEKKAAEGKSVDVSGVGSGVQRKEVEVGQSEDNSMDNEIQENINDEINNVEQVDNENVDSGEQQETITVNIDADKIVINLNGAEVKKISINNIRSYLIKNYNWSGIVMLMKVIADNNSGFTYIAPLNLSGNSEDDIRIVPNEACKFIVLMQANYLISNNEAIIGNSNLDGLAGDSFISNIISNIISGDNDENSYETKAEFMNQDSESLDDFDFSESLDDFGSSSNKKNMYDALKELVLTRNGLWSDEDRIVNIIGIKKGEGSRNTTETKIVTNDYFFVTYKDGETYEVKKFIGSADPGKAANGMVMPNQTINLKPGYHQSYQPGGRTSNILRKNKNNEEFSFEKFSSMNHHKANSSHGLFYRNSNNEDIKPLKINGQSGNGWLYKDGDDFKKISNGSIEFTLDEEVAAGKKYKVKKASMTSPTTETPAVSDTEVESEEEIFTLVLGAKPKLLIDNTNLWDTDLKMYSKLTELQRTMINHGKKYADLTSEQKAIIDGYIDEIVEEMDKSKIEYKNEDGEKEFMELNYKTQLERYVRDSSWGSDISANTSTEVPSAYSKGCHVFPSSKDYYEYLDSWQQFSFSDDENKKTTQNRWYYTIVDSSTFNIINSEQSSE